MLQKGPQNGGWEVVNLCLKIPPKNDPRGAFFQPFYKGKGCIYIYICDIHYIYRGSFRGDMLKPSLQLIAMTALTQLDLLLNATCWNWQQSLPKKKSKKVKNQLTKTFAPSCVCFFHCLIISKIMPFQHSTFQGRRAFQGFILICIVVFLGVGRWMDAVLHGAGSWMIEISSNCYEKASWGFST